MEKYYVYILRCNDGSLYTGVTNSVELRVAQHHEGIDATCYTFRRRPLKLVYVTEFSEILDAIAWEKKLKRWSRKKKEAVVRGNGRSCLDLRVIKTILNTWHQKPFVTIVIKSAFSSVSWFDRAHHDTLNTVKIVSP